MNDLAVLSKALKMTLFPGTVVIFQIEHKFLQELDSAIKGILPILRSANIQVLAFSDDVSIVMVPEAKKVLTLAKSI